MDSIPGSMNYEFGEDEFQKLILAPDTPTHTPPSTNGNSFTALLELPSNQAMELLTDPPPRPPLSNGGATTTITTTTTSDVVKRHRISAFNSNINHSFTSLPAFPTNRALIERAAKYSVFASEEDDSNSVVELKVKSEPLDSGSNPNSSDPTGTGTGGSESEKEKPLKRKEREKKGKGTSKKNKTTSDDGEKLPYVHVRARRGQATDSHSLAERARREKINARMKLLQELVPGCNKISGTALVLDEIINHVQYLQRQVEYLSMRLAAVNPRIDFNLDSLISGGAESMDCSFPNVAMPLMWPETHVNGDRPQFQQQYESLSQPVWIKEENHCNVVASENSLMTYNSPPNSASLHASQLKMEL